MNLRREQLLASLSDDIRLFGYPQCTPDNVLTDRIYSMFARKMLEDIVAEFGEGTPQVVHDILAEMKPADQGAERRRNEG